MVTHTGFDLNNLLQTTGMFSICTDSLDISYSKRTFFFKCKLFANHNIKYTKQTVTQIAIVLLQQTIVPREGGRGKK